MARYTLIFYGNQNDEGWESATAIALLGAESFVNASSIATDNPDPASNGALFFGPNDPVTRLPSENSGGYVARFEEIQAGADGAVSLTLRSDGELPGSTGGKFANALGLIETPGPTASPFLRGDLDFSGMLDIADPIHVLRVLFAGQPTTCLDALDIDGSEVLDLTDPVMLLTYLFTGGAPPAAPFPDCGVAPVLGCDFSPSCL